MKTPRFYESRRLYTLGESSDHIMDGFRSNRNAILIESCYINSTSIQHIDVVLANHGVGLLFAEASITKHTDLLGNVLPIIVIWRALVKQGFTKQSSHLLNAGHSIQDFSAPFLKEEKDGIRRSTNKITWGGEKQKILGSKKHKDLPHSDRGFLGL